MIFFKANLITITIVVITIWVIPPTQQTNPDYVCGKCKEILKDYCNFKNDLTDLDGTVNSKFERILENKTPEDVKENKTPEDFKNFLCQIKLDNEDLPDAFKKYKNIYLKNEMLLLLKSFALKYMKHISIQNKNEINIEDRFEHFCSDQISHLNHKGFLDMLISKLENSKLQSLLGINVNELHNDKTIQLYIVN